MPSYQLTLSPEYVPEWGTNEAFRELFQNGIDRENENSESKFYVNYTVFDRRIVLGNPDTYLHKSTLLLGKTTKDGKTTIGKYGEGYKLALLVLLRQGCRIRIENGSEVWIPRIVKSRVFGCDIIQIDVEKNKNSDGWLRYIIDGITPEQYSDFQEKCLLFYPDTPALEAVGDGRVLLDERFKGKVFCNGLFVCNHTGLQYGYDIPPNKISLNRDRNKVDSYNLTWQTSTIWRELKNKETIEKVHELVKKEAVDVEYYTNIWSSDKSPIYKAVCELTYKDFLKKHGDLAVAVKNEEERDFIRSKYGDLVPVIVPDKVYVMFQSSESHVRSSESRSQYVEKTPVTWVLKWLEAELDIKENKKEELLGEAAKWRYA